MDDERSRCYELLGLAPGASAEELKAAHRDLVKVWHPDRFAHDPRLREKAQEKLKEINEAYEFLTNGRPARRAQPRVDRGEPSPRQGWPEPPPRGRSRWPSLLLAVAVFCAVAAVALRTLRTSDGAPARATARPAGSATEARPSEDAQPAAAQPAQGRKRPAHENPEAAVKEPAARDTAAPQPLPTVTVLIDPTSGLLATPECPVRSRRTYAGGQEPRRHCDAHRKAEKSRANFN